MLRKLFQWYHDAPVEGKIVGSKVTTAQYAGHGDIVYKKHVCPSDIIPDQSYVQFSKTVFHNLLSSIDPNNKSLLQGWGKVVGMTRQDSGPSNGPYKVAVEVDGDTRIFDITSIKKSIPKPLSAPQNG